MNRVPYLVIYKLTKKKMQFNFGRCQEERFKTRTQPRHARNVEIIFAEVSLDQLNLFEITEAVGADLADSL
jgi:hypothetical protein